MANALYDGYDEWKDWNAAAFMRPGEGDRCHYATELSHVPIAGEKVLEIGFGNGGFLGWAQDQGARLYGTEVSERALELAARNGVTTLPADLRIAAGEHAGAFALIVAFDVLEHLTHAEIDTTMDAAARLLRPGGHFLARFPNGQSPFGRVHQHADATHLSILSAPLFTQLIRGKPFTVRRAGDAFPIAYGRLPAAMARRARNAVRPVVEKLVMALFGFRAPLGTDTIVLLERT